MAMKLLLLVATLLVPAALPCGGDQAAGQCGASREPSLARLVEDLHGETVLSRLLPADAKQPAAEDTAPVKNSDTKVIHVTDKTLQTVSKEKNTNREETKPAVAAQKEPQSRSAANVQGTGTNVGKDKKTPSPSKEENVNKILTRPSSPVAKEAPRKNPSLSKEESVNQIRAPPSSPVSVETAGKDKKTPSLSKEESAKQIRTPPSSPVSVETAGKDKKTPSLSKEESAKQIRTQPSSPVSVETAGKDKKIPSLSKEESAKQIRTPPSSPVSVETAGKDKKTPSLSKEESAKQIRTQPSSPVSVETAGKDKKIPSLSKEESAKQIRTPPSSPVSVETAGKDKKIPSLSKEESAKQIRTPPSSPVSVETAGKDKKTPLLSKEESVNQIRTLPSSPVGKEAPGKDKTPPTLLKAQTPNRTPNAAGNQIRSPDTKDAHLKHAVEKDKAAPPLSKGKSSSTDAVKSATATKKVILRSTADASGKGLNDVTSPPLSRKKTAKTSAEAVGNKVQRVVSEGHEPPARDVSGKDKQAPSPSDDKSTEKQLPRRPATDSGRKEVHVKVDGSETEVTKEGRPERKDVKKLAQAGQLVAVKSQQAAARQKRDVEENTRRPQEAGKTLPRDVGVEAEREVSLKQAAVVEAKGGTAKENVTGGSLLKNGSKSDEGKTGQPRSPQVLSSTAKEPVEETKVEKSDKQAAQEVTAVVPSMTHSGKEEETLVKDANERHQPNTTEEQSGEERMESDEYVHFLTESTAAEDEKIVGQEVTPAAPQVPEALPLTGLEEPEDGPPSAMSLKTRRHPDSDDEEGRGRQEGDEARQADPRRFPSGGYRSTGKTDTPVLQFPALPEGETFRTPELGLSEGLFLFSYLGDFLSWLQPYDFPVELVRDALWNRVTVTDLITESLQVEVGFIICLCIGALLALLLPIIAMCHACCNVVRGSKKSGGDRSSWDSSSSSGSCRRRGLLCSLHLVLLLLVAGVAAMFVTNEQVSNAVHSTPSVMHTALGDVGAFVRTTHHQLSFVTTKSLEQALSAATDDLDNADVLLGRPIQQEIAHEAGADVALEALSDVLTAVSDVSQKAVVLHEQCSETRGLALVAKERLADLRHQVDMAKRQCVGRDRALCDTLDVSGLDVVIRLETIMSDDQLAALRSLRNGNFSAAAQQARGDFQLIPREVEESTREARLGIRRELVRQRSHVQDSLVSLDSLSRDVGIRVDAARNLVMSAMQTVEEMEQWRWVVGLGASVTMLLLWLLLISGAACGCCGSQEKARSTLIAGVCFTSIFSLALWVMTLVTLVMGGHGEVFICRPLYASPDYNALSRLLDRPGVLFPRGGGGFFRNVVGGDYGPNRTLDVPLRQVLQECEAGIPAYNALQLRQVFDTDFATGHGRWDSLRMQLSRLNVDVASLRVLTPGLQEQLGNILSASGANVTQHRLALGGAVTARDLNTLADQLLGIASQASDLAMASRLETLAARTRRLLASHVLPLEQRKEDLVYRLTALEVSLVPLQRQTNQSLSHLKAIQYYVTHQGESIAQSAVDHYTTRILSYLQQARAHILTSVVKDVSPCRPLFEVFNAARQLLCRHIVDPLNGLWFASALSLLLLLIATPLCLKLIDAFKQNREGGLLSSNMSESPSEAVDMPGNWNTPGTGEQDGW